MPTPHFTRNIGPLPRPTITVETADETVISTLTLDESERLASIVVSALIVHFGTHESLPSWPDCLENHIARFLHISQMPIDYVAATLAVLAAISDSNPYMYAEFDDAEAIFMTAMVHVVGRMNKLGKMDRHQRHAFKFQDRRWKTTGWFANEQKMYLFLNKKSAFVWADKVDTETFLLDPRSQGWEQIKLSPGKNEARCQFFEMALGVFKRGEPMDEKDQRRWGSAGPVQLVPAGVQCRTGLCALERGDLYPIIDDEETGLPINLEYRPTGQYHGDGDFKHTKHGILDKWTQVLNPKYCWERFYVNAFVMGPYQKAYIMYSRDKREYAQGSEKGEKASGKEDDGRSKWTDLFVASSTMRRKEVFRADAMTGTGAGGPKTGA